MVASRPTEPQPAPPASPPAPTLAAAKPPAVAPRKKSRPAPEVARLEGRFLLPDLRGLTVAEVKAVSKRAQLSVEITGRGRAVAQSPPPGTVMAASGAHIQVRCEADPI